MTRHLILTATLFLAACTGSPEYMARGDIPCGPSHEPLMNRGFQSPVVQWSDRSRWAASLGYGRVLTPSEFAAYETAAAQRCAEAGRPHYGVGDGR